MLFTKHKKIIVGLAAIAAMTLGGATAMAATAVPTLTPVSNVDLSKVVATPGTLTIVEGATPQIESNTDSTTTAPSLTEVPGAKLTGVEGNFDVSSVQAGNYTIKIVTSQGLKAFTSGQNFTTAAK